MTNYIILNRKKHISLLADHRIDPVTKELLKVGDEVCACAVCKTVYSRKVWEAVKSKTCCKQKKTLIEIPNTEYINFEKISDEHSKKQNPTRTHYGCAFAIALLSSIALGTSTWYFYSNYEDKATYSEILLERNDALYSKNTKISQEKISLQERLGKMRDLKFRVGRLSSSNYSGFDNHFLVYLHVGHPLTLNHLYVHPKSTGSITIKLYKFSSDSLIASKGKYLYFSNQKNKVNVNFNIAEQGRYYLKLEGDVKLSYHYSSPNEYEKYKNGVLQITGT